MNDDLVLQDPAETLDHSIDWSDFLATDTVAASAWSVTPAGPTLSQESIGAAATSTACYLAGVALGQVYRLANQITTAAGRIAERSLTVRGWSE